jgi:arsenite transporter
LIALLYTIIIIFAEQAHNILQNLGPVFRTFVPLVLYFTIMWTATFFGVWRLSIRYGKATWGYQMAVVQAFTAASNNFELAIAVCVSVYGANSQQALAATIGPLVEVPVLLTLSWVALFIGRRLRWDVQRDMSVSGGGAGRAEKDGHVDEADSARTGSPMA